MRILTFKAPIPFKLSVPDWFMNNRGDRGIVFENLQVDGSLPEIETYKWMREYMKNFPKNSIFLDIGAQIGLSTIPIACEGYEVIAVEPVSFNIKTLKENVALNKLTNVRIAEIAAYSENKTMNIFVPVEQDCASLSEDASRAGGVTTEEVVTAMKMDDWIADNKIDINRIKFIKIDVQGAEEHVINGLTNLLEKVKNISILMEWDPRMMSSMGTNEFEFYQKICSSGFRAYRVGADVLFVR